MTVKAYGTNASTLPLSKLEIGRREVGKNDIEIEILYCGVCHSDVHTARNEWKDTIYPVVPGHEIIGKVIKTGAEVSAINIGEIVGVGCMVDSCRECRNCQNNEEQFCEKGAIFTYNSPDNLLNTATYGGYSKSIVVTENFVLKIPENIDLASAAPLLCAGITTYSPLKRWKIGKGMKVGIAGIGGLGHVAIKIAKAMGAEVIAFTTSETKKFEAKRLGADFAVNSLEKKEMKTYADSLDFILDTISADHDINQLLRLLKLDGVLTLVGLPVNSLTISPFKIAFPRRIVTGSGIGGIAETQEMLNFCAVHNITCQTELIDIQYINQAYDRMIKGDVKYRFVIDMSTLKS